MAVRRWQAVTDVSLVLVILLAPGVATGQLTGADIQALRERGVAEGWTFTVRESPATRQSLDALCGMRVPANWRDGARFVACPEKFDPPPTFDWRARDGCTPIKAQGACGSCWAFATVGPLESAIRIKDGTVVDLSEQWLLECNIDGYDCEQGGWFAHDYHMDKPDACGGTGAVLEAACPYLAEVRPCACPYPHSYWIDSWAYIAGEEEIPSVDSIKWGIMAYGPVGACVVTCIEFAAYHYGFYNHDEQGDINHAVVLVGWDDTQGTDGVWLLRNSWGSYWGESGYMHIAYGCSSIGYGACVIDYPGQAPVEGPTITNQPRGAVAAQGFSQTFSVEATTENGALRYQWQHNGENVTGQIPSGAYRIHHVTPEDAGIYRCIVRDPKGSVLSDDAYLEVGPGPVPAAHPLALAILACLFLALGASHRHPRRPRSR